MYVDWPATLPDPEAPFTGELTLPLAKGPSDTIGALVTNRNQTRPMVAGTARLIFDDGVQFDLFRTFWRDTLTNGTARFNAPWIALLGYDGYYGKVVGYEITISGVMPVASLDIELIPGFILDGADISPWPAP